MDGFKGLARFTAELVGKMKNLSADGAEKSPDPNPPAVETKPPEASAAVNPEELARPAVERLSEDEALRGDLSDIGYGPLLDWGIAAALGYAKSEKNPAPADIEAYTNRLRAVIQAAVYTAQDGKLDNPAELLDFDTKQQEKLTKDLQALSLGDDADTNAEQIAAILQTGL